MKTLMGREIPDYIEGYGPVLPFEGAFVTDPGGLLRQAGRVKAVRPGESKIVPSLEEVFQRIPVRDGMTLSFHHHLRNGDGVTNMVLETAARQGIKNLKIASSGVFPVHAPLVEHMKNGVITAFDLNGMLGPIAKAVSLGMMEQPVILRTHGGRARAIECGQLHIDVAFIGAPAADRYGNLTGVKGPAACGSLGYAFPDAEYADHVVAVTDCLTEYPLTPISIPQTRVDYVVRVDSIGDPRGIMSGTTRITRDPVQLKIAELAARAIQATGLIKNEFSFQTGAGGVSLAVAGFVRRIMEQEGVTGSFVLGGITSYLVEMLEKGLFRTAFDVQSFDLDAVRSLAENPRHLEIGAGFYANPFNSGPTVNNLDVVILGATEIDVDFNVNVVTGADGVAMAGIGGHGDTAAGAKTAIVVANLLRGRLPIVVEEVLTVTTPGESVDMLVTERGIAVNPRRQDLKERLVDAGLPVRTIRELKKLAEDLAGVPDKLATGDKVVAVVEYRDGTIIDVVRQVKG